MNTRAIKRTPSALGCLLLVLAASLSLSAPAHADVVSTGELVRQSELESMKGELRAFVARDSVREQLLELGVAPADIDQRIDALTDQEILQMHDNLDSMPAGEGLLGTVIGLLVIFMLLDIAGVTDIFPSI